MAALSGVQQAPIARTALVSGVIERAGGAELAPALPVPAFDDGRWRPDGGSHCLRLLSADGAPMEEHCFEPEFDPEHGPPGAASFAFVLPWPDGVASLALVRGGVTLAERTAGAGAPNVEIEPLVASAPLTGTHQIRWHATDPDGEALNYTVLPRHRQ